MCAQSHVSGGFWLQLSSPLTDALPDVQGGVKAVSCTIIAGIWAAFFQECQQESCAQVLQESVSMDEWEVVWLRKGRKGGGLSGGWRGFAIDMELSAGNHHHHHNPTRLLPMNEYQLSLKIERLRCAGDTVLFEALGQDEGEEEALPRIRATIYRALPLEDNPNRQ